MLEKISLFASLSDSEFDTLSMFCQERQYKAGEFLFHQWEEATAMYILISGSLEVFNERKVLWLIQPWEFVGEMAIFAEPKDRSASVKALEDSNVIILLSFSVQELSRTHPEITDKIHQVILKRKQENKANDV